MPLTTSAPRRGAFRSRCRASSSRSGSRCRSRSRPGGSGRLQSPHSADRGHRSPVPRRRRGCATAGRRRRAVRITRTRAARGSSDRDRRVRRGRPEAPPADARGDGSARHVGAVAGNHLVFLPLRGRRARDGGRRGRRSMAGRARRRRDPGRVARPRRSAPAHRLRACRPRGDGLVRGATPDRRAGPRTSCRDRASSQGR